MANLIYCIFLFLLVFPPLAFGTTGQWSKTLVEGLCFLLILLCLSKARWGKSPFYSAPGLLPLILLAGVPFIQLIPLPPPFLRLVSPKTWELYSGTIWIVRPDIWMPLSVTPKSTLAEFFRLAAYGAFYLMAVQILAERERLKKTVTLFATFAGLFSLVGIILFIVSKGRFFGFLGGWPFEPAHSMATNANINHYAALVAMMLPVALAQFLASKPQVSYSSLRVKIADFIRNPSSNPQIPLGFSLALLAIALLLSLSWGAILSSVGSLLLFMFLFISRDGARKRGIPSAFFLVASLLAVALFGWGATWGKLGWQGTDPALVAGERALVWRDTVNIIGDFPLLGTGVGTFADIYPRYKTTQAEKSMVEHAHNEYLEYAAEGGLVGILLIGCFLLSVLRKTYPVWRTRHSRTSVYLYLGSLSGLGAILFHSFTNATLHVGAIGLYFFFFAALAVASATIPSRRGKRGGTERETLSPACLYLAIVPAVVLLSINLAFNAGVLMGRARFAEVVVRNQVGGATVEERLAAQRITGQAARFDPLEAGYRYARADAGLASGDAPMSLDQFGAALRLNPSNAECLQRLGLVFDNLGQDEKAEQLLRAGVENDRSDPERHRVFAFWLLSKGKMEKGLEQIRHAIHWGPQKTPDFLTLMTLYGLSDEEMRGILPEGSVPLLAYGDYLVSAGKESAAEESYRAAVRYAAREKRVSPSLFLRIADFYSERTRYNEALEVIQAGIGNFPENAELRFSAANLFEELGITYRAVEEYRGALILDPGNEGARERLKMLAGEVK